MPPTTRFWQCNNCRHLIFGADLNCAACRICLTGYLFPITWTADLFTLNAGTGACDQCGAIHQVAAEKPYLCDLCGHGNVNPIHPSLYVCSSAEASGPVLSEPTTSSAEESTTSSTSSKSPEGNITALRPASNTPPE